MATTKKTIKELSYRELQSQLDAALAKLENPDLDIDEATTAYEEGLHLIQKLQTHLQTAENKIQKIQADFSQNTEA